MATIIQKRYDTAVNWTTANPVLAIAEEGYESDTGKVKIGDGITVWNSLDYHIGTEVPEGAMFTDTIYDDTNVVKTTDIGTVTSSMLSDTYLTAETSHVDVIVDGDFIANGYMKRTAEGVYTTVDETYALDSHNHSGVYEIADSTILKNANIGVTVQAYNADTVVDASYVHTDNNFTTVLKNKLDGVEDSANNYVLPSTVVNNNETNTFTLPQIGSVVAEDLAIDLSTGNNFTASGTGTLSFTNATNGQSGNILLTSTGAISTSAYCDSNFLTTVSTAGTYWVSYSVSGGNVYLATSGALTVGGA
jgi:hypothetical protein